MTTDNKNSQKSKSFDKSVDLEVCKTMSYNKFSIQIHSIKECSNMQVMKDNVYLDKKAEFLLKLLKNKRKTDAQILKTKTQLESLLLAANPQKEATVQELVNKLLEYPVTNEQQVLLIASSYDMKIGTQLLDKIMASIGQ